MKKILLTLLLLTGLRASAFDWTYSTNLFWTITTPTNIFCGTNSTDPARDSYIVIWNKLNADINLMWQRIGTATNGSGGGITNFVLTATNLPAGSPATVTNTGVVGGIAYLQIGIPAGQPGTNFVTVNQFTNVFLSSAQFTTFATNNITWSTSNYLARVNGLYDWLANFGQLGGSGMSPGTNVAGHLVGSLTGTNAWFTLTNGFFTTNTISVSAVGAGGGLGYVRLFAVDHPELLNRTNAFFGQFVRFHDPLDPQDAATKNYVDNSIAASKSGNFTSYSDTNGVFHYLYSVNNTTLFDLWSALTYIPLAGLTLDGTGTNVALSIVATNLANGYAIQSSTNLFLGSAGFLGFTNYTLTTNSGVATFTIPVNFSEPMRFWRAISSSVAGAAFNVPVSGNGSGLTNIPLTSLTASGTAGQVVTLDSAGALTLSNAAAGGLMNFDGGLITSDGSGTIIGNNGFCKLNMNGSGLGYLCSGQNGQDAFQAGGLIFSGYNISADGGGYVNIANLYVSSIFINGSSPLTTVTTDGTTIGGDGASTPLYIVAPSDSSGNGGTVILIKASDNGSQMYLHVTSAGVITATSSP